MARQVKVVSEVTGSVWKVLVQPGQQVAQGESLYIVESMKMEIPVESPVSGTVFSLACAEGQAVYEGEALAVVEAA